MDTERRFTRVGCSYKALVSIDNVLAIEVNILNISLNGAFLELKNDFVLQEGDKWPLTFELPGSDVNLKFDTEVVHARMNRVGVKFTHVDIDTMIHLRSLLEARSANPQQIANELAFLT